jgi:hypothetical protein
MVIFVTDRQMGNMASSGGIPPFGLVGASGSLCNRQKVSQTILSHFQVSLKSPSSRTTPSVTCQEMEGLRAGSQDFPEASGVIRKKQGKLRTCIGWARCEKRRRQRLPRGGRGEAPYTGLLLHRLGQNTARTNAHRNEEGSKRAMHIRRETGTEDSTLAGSESSRRRVDYYLELSS